MGPIADQQPVATGHERGILHEPLKILFVPDEKQARRRKIALDQQIDEAIEGRFSPPVGDIQKTEAAQVLVLIAAETGNDD